jgi:hypothetical protein
MGTIRSARRVLTGVIAGVAVAAAVSTGVAFADGGHGRGAGRAHATAVQELQQELRTNVAQRLQAAVERRHGLAGALTKIDGTKLTVKTPRGDQIVLVTDKTTFRAKGQDSFKLADLVTRFNALKAGETLRIAVQGDPSADGLVANRIAVGKVRTDKPDDNRSLVRTEGKVTAVAADSVTVQPSTGSAKTFKIVKTTLITLRGTIALAKDQTVTVATRDGSDEALLIRVHPAP